MEVDIEQKFIKACETYSDDLFRYSYFKTSDIEVAQDLVQDTFMKSWDQIVKGNDLENIKAFFYKVLNNLIIDYYRKKKSASLESLSEDTNFEPSFSESTEDRIDTEKSLLVLDEIGDSYKDVILMRYIQELSLKEISEITGEAPNTIAVKIHRGLKKAKEILRDKMKKEHE